MLNACFDIIIDYKSALDYLEPELETAMDLGISKEEMKEICDYYNCKYYQLTRIMVTIYHKQKR